MTHDPTKLAQDFCRTYGLAENRPGLVKAMAEHFSALRRPTPPPDVAKLRELVGRVEHASNMFHNSQRWHEEDSPDGNGTMWDWVIAPAADALPSQDAPSAPPSDEVERVARVLCKNKRDRIERLSPGLGLDLFDWDTLDEDVREEFREDARAAIAALQVKP